MNSKKLANNKKHIVFNKHAFYEYFIEKEYEAGLTLQGWEVKSLRSGNVSIKNSYVSICNSEALLLGSIFTPLRISCKYQIFPREFNRWYG